VRFVSPWKRCLICVGKAQLAKARSQTHLISAYRTLTMGF
jgi:phosphoribosyl-dephospho-CoA transferase